MQVGTIDALLATLCIDRKLTLLTVDADFEHVARIHPLKILAGIGQPRLSRPIKGRGGIDERIMIRFLIELMPKTLRRPFLNRCPERTNRRRLQAFVVVYRIRPGAE